MIREDFLEQEMWKLKSGRPAKAFGISRRVTPGRDTSWSRGPKTEHLDVGLRKKWKVDRCQTGRALES